MPELEAVSEQTRMCWRRIITKKVCKDVAKLSGTVIKDSKGSVDAFVGAHDVFKRINVYYYKAIVISQVG